jgi:hypothetical protein
MQIDDRDPNAYYQSKLGVRFYDLFTGDAHDNGPVKGDVGFYIECAREFGGPVRERINDPVRQLVTETHRIEELDESGITLVSEESSWTLRWSTRQEMRYLFELTGFEVIAEYSDFFRAPPAYGNEQLWVLRKA